MSVEVVLVPIALAAIAVIFLVGAWQKLRDPMAFEIAIDAYELVPPAAAKPLAYAVPVCEASAAVMLLLESSRHFGATLALALLAVVTAAVIVNLLRGRTDVGCGCGGLEDEQTLSWALVARNVVLVILIVAASSAAPLRELLWLDYATITAGTVCLYGLYVLANQLIANQPRLLKLRTTT